MIKNQNNFTTSFYFNKYLSNYDLLSKYLIKTKELIPSLNDITIKLNLKQISANEKQKTELSSIQRFRMAYFFLFSFFLQKPKIKTKIQNITEESIQKEIINSYTISSQVSSKQKIDDFIHFFFIEMWNKLFALNIHFFFKNIKNPKNKNIILETSLKIPFFAIPNLELFYDLTSNDVNIEDSFIFFIFKFKNVTYKNKENIIKNLPFFWKT